MDLYLLAELKTISLKVSSFENIWEFVHTSSNLNVIGRLGKYLAAKISHYIHKLLTTAYDPYKFSNKSLIVRR